MFLVRCRKNEVSMVLKNIFLFILIAVTTSCSVFKSNDSKELKIISMEKEFVHFWDQAKGKSFDKRLVLWDQIVEKPYRDFYDEIVWSKQYSKKWLFYKKKAMKRAFSRFEKDYDLIMKNFKSFDKTLRQQVKFYKKQFPDANFSLPIYAAVAPTFNGRVADIKGKMILTFSMDMMVFLKDNPDTLYAHELFHVYQNKFLQISEEGLKKEKFSINLWTEGFATFVAAHFHPKAKMSDVFMSKKLAQLNENKLKAVSRLFLKVVDKPALDMKDLNKNRIWFGAGTNLSKHYPDRMGYWLGYHVIKKLSEKYEPKNMVSWSPERLHREVKKELQLLTL